MALTVLRTRDEMRLWRQRVLATGQRVGFVPTMGALHKGHRALMELAVAENDLVVLSVFVNPTQFAATDDLGAYPRTLEADLAMAESAGAAAVFLPSAGDIYPSGFGTQISVASSLSDVLEGAARPGHFAGVCLVVTILLNLVEPHRVYFGQKDYQQVVVLKTLLAELAHPSQIVIVPTVRDADGLALSSRNVYLSPQARQRGLGLPRALAAAAALYDDGVSDPMRLLAAVNETAHSAECPLEYALCFDLWTLTPARVQDSAVPHEMVILATARINTGREHPHGDASTGLTETLLSGPPLHVRLLDNLVLSRDPFWTGERRKLILCFEQELDFSVSRIKGQHP